MFSLIGLLLGGVSSFFSSLFAEKTAQINADATVTVAETQASERIIHDTADDLGVKIMRDIALLPPVVWSALIGWDTIVASHYPALMFHVVAYPPGVAYIPYAAFVFLFGNVGLNMWSRMR